MTHRWRSKIVEWAYQIVDHYSYSRELVEVTLSLLDRYLCTSLATKHTFQLAAMTCLYIALKTHAPNGTSMSVESLLTLARGFFGAEDVIRMENEILMGLNWHVFPVTCLTWIEHMVHLIPPFEAEGEAEGEAEAGDGGATRKILGNARYVSELCVSSYPLSLVPCSTRALSAVILAARPQLSSSTLNSFLSRVAAATKIDVTSFAVTSTMSMMENFVEGGAAGGLLTKMEAEEGTSLGEDSPTSVVQNAMSLASLNGLNKAAKREGKNKKSRYE